MQGDIMAKILISAGEASGDIHAAAVTAAIKKLDSKADGLWQWAVTLCVRLAVRCCGTLRTMA